VVLLGLLGAALWSSNAINDADADSKMDATAPKKLKEMPPLDMAAERNAIQTVKNPEPVVLSGAHNTFNPVTWKRKPDGTLMKILVEGPQALSITSIKPVYMTISYDRAAGSGFYMTIQSPNGRKTQEYLKVNEKVKSGLFTIKEAKGGTPEDPNELVLEFTANQETISVKKDQPIQKVEGFVADLKYEPENKTFNKQRVGDNLIISGEPYKVIAISTNEVRVGSNSGKQTTIKWTGTPTP
jgi:hypothetical protein